MDYPIFYPAFFTATILEWKHLLKPDKYKAIITESLAFLVKQKRIEVFGFVIMSNHIHIIWRCMPAHILSNVQLSFMKYTAQLIIKDLRNLHPQVLPHFIVNAKDRKYQIWERNPLSIELRSNDVLFQKLQYIHQNPVRAGVCQQAADYYYSSAKLYVNGSCSWDFVEKWEVY
ncbi:MAG: transposase [Deinococcales bacterium]|nr:transposase [Chitinophagaceae bacterium]